MLKMAPSLSPDDIVVTPSGVTGEDLYLSPRAREVYPIAIEAKNQQSLNIWSALEQAESHAKKTPRVPILAFKRNNTKLRIAIDAVAFFSLAPFLHLLKKSVDEPAAP